MAEIAEGLIARALVAPRRKCTLADPNDAILRSGLIRQRQDETVPGRSKTGRGYNGARAYAWHLFS